MLQFRQAICSALIGFAIFSAGCNQPMPATDPNHRAEGETSPISQPGVPSLKGTYSLDVVCDTNSELRITKITIAENKTIVNLVFKATRTPRIRTAAPGQQSAFYIADPNSRDEYKLLNVEGIAMDPVWTELQEGESLDFKLTFERIPDSLTTFHLIEGKTQNFSEDGLPTRSWTFMNVKLR